MLIEEKLHQFQCKSCNRKTLINATELKKCEPWNGPYCTKCGRRLKEVKKVYTKKKRLRRQAKSRIQNISGYIVAREEKFSNDYYYWT